ncbi:glycerol-3-phosphate dehydrogenase/oxidase [Camelliibacillus cellulosilyticus]|uniref:Glycerol-3-phosphate dehydrogenase n=1 Tax=Camelliibacillus cellulosilyticus TaxID=2174486 RepID=A0ABV9GMP4_9BACL
MKNTFSSIQRSVLLDECSAENWDVLVVGGGITGAGIALDACARGMKTALIEMQDFAAGTSSRSTKLVHGGLRYLKQFEVKIVAEVGKERAIVYENAPHVTTPLWMLLPIIKGGTFGKFTTSVGLTMYDRLAGVKKSERRSMLKKHQVLEKEPLIRKDNLKGGGYYVEYRTDDARLTMEVMKEAVRRGVKAVNYVKAEELLYDNGKLVGVRAVDQLSGQSRDIHAKKIINATGPWVDELREKDHSKKGKYLHLTKGVHITIDGKRFPLRQAVYFDTPDGRMVFAIPREGKAYIGTTDTNYTTDFTNPRMTVADRDYLLQAANFMFPEVHLKPEDVESSWAGVRPLIHEEGKDPSEISRKDEIFHSESGLITIAGGKLTGYRKMAERVVDLVAEELKSEGDGPFRECETAYIRLSGGDVGGSDQLPEFIKNMTREGTALGLSSSEAERLAERYGSNVTRLYEIIRTMGEEAAHYNLPKDVFAMIVYAIEEEMAATPSDFFIRRTGALFFNIGWVRKWKESVIDYMATRLHWDDDTKAGHVRALEERLRDATVAVEKE